MPDPEDKKMFWMTLPGILTGTASIITALVTALSFATSRQSSKQVSSSDGPPRTSIISPDIPAKEGQSGDSCQKIVGTWNWFIGVTSAFPDGSIIWKKNAADLVPSVTGHWTCTDSSAPRFIVRWSHGFTDNVTVSSDGRSLTGFTQENGIQVFAAKQ